MRSPASAAPKAVFRLDAGGSIGGGHAVRCVALADALAEDGWMCVFAVAELGAGLVRRLTTRHLVTSIAHEAVLDPVALMQALPEKCELLVIDHYGWSAEQESACRPWAQRILALDDLCDRPHACDVLLDPSLDRRASDYAKWTRAQCALLLSPGFALLRAAFPALRIVRSPRPHETAPRIFVSFGLVDADNYVEHALHALSLIEFTGRVDVVLGSQAPHLARVQALVHSAAPNVRLHVEPGDLASLMDAADLAIGAAGGSAWERCCLGLPSIVVSAAANQDLNARTLAARGACELLSAADPAFDAALSQALSRLLQEPDILARMSGAAAAVTDGRGARRTALALRPERTRHGASVTLRRLTLQDAERTYTWQQHPATRRYSRDPRPPSREQHLAWVHRKLAEPGSVLDVIEHDGTAAGVVRLDHVARGGSEIACEVSIYVAPELGGLGIATAALAALRRLAPEALLLAYVLPENVASRALFAKAGYALEDGVHVNRPAAR